MGIQVFLHIVLLYELLVLPSHSATVASNQQLNDIRHANYNDFTVDCPDHLEVTLKGTVLEYHKSRAGNFTQSYDGTYWANQHGNAIWYYRNQWRIGYLEDLYTATEGIHSRSIEANLCPNSETIQWKYAAHDGTFNDADDNVLVREVQADPKEPKFLRGKRSGRLCRDDETRIVFSEEVGYRSNSLRESFRHRSMATSSQDYRAASNNVDMSRSSMYSDQQSSESSGSGEISFGGVTIGGGGGSTQSSASANAVASSFASANSLITNRQGSHEWTKTDKTVFQSGYHIYRHSTTTILIDGKLGKTKSVDYVNSGPTPQTDAQLRKRAYDDLLNKYHNPARIYGTTYSRVICAKNPLLVAQLRITGRDINYRDRHENTALHTAAEYDLLEAAKWLLGHGADVNAKNVIRRTPLHWAAMDGSVEVARLLIDRGAKVDAIDVHGYTPLHSAADWNSLKVARLLIDNGANKNIENNNGEKPIDIARYHSYSEMVALLQ